MKVVGFKRGAAPSGIGSVAVVTNYGVVWIDPYSRFFAGRRTPISRREIIRAVKAAPYGRAYSVSGVGSVCYDNTLLLAPTKGA